MHFISLTIFRSNLNIVRDLADRAAQGRACGNLGNTHYLLGNFKQAIMYHEEVSLSLIHKASFTRGFLAEFSLLWI